MARRRRHSSGVKGPRGRMIYGAAATAYKKARRTRHRKTR